MKICFSARAAYQWVSPMIFKQLQTLQPDIEALFIADNKKNEQLLAAQNPGTEVLNLASFLRSHWHELGVDTLSLLAGKYDCEPVWKYIYTDRFLINTSYEYAVKIAAGLFLFYESIFNSGEIGIYYDETIATLHSYVAYLVGKAYGVKYIGQMTFRKAETKFHYNFTDPFQHIIGFDERYRNKDYPPDVVQSATEYLQEFEKSQGKSDIMSYVKTKPKPEIKWALHGLWLFCHKEFHDPCDYVNYKYYNYFFKRTKYFGRYLRCKKYYHKPDMGKKYVFFPLHYQPEASTIVCAQKYEKQVFFIDSLAKSLPSDTLLYVKEHYALIGHRDPYFYKQLSHYPNVRMIDPFQSSLELINNAQAVVTLTGTAGWEAMLLRKPVILGGQIYFDNAPGVMKADDIFQNYLTLMAIWKQPTRADILKYLCECFSNIHEGCAYFSRIEFRTEENISKIAVSLMDVIKNWRN